MMTKHFLTILICLFCLILMLGCTMRLGKRMPDGTYQTLEGEVVGFYIGPYDLTLQSGLQILSSLEMPVHERRTLRDGIVLRSETPGGSPLRLQFIKEGRAITMVRIGTGRLGYGNNEFSYQLHALMKAQLKRLNQQRAKLTRMNRQKPVPEPPNDITPTVASTDSRTAASASKPSAPVKLPALKPEGAKLSNEGPSERTAASPDTTPAHSASKPPAPVQSPTPESEAAQLPNEEDSERKPAKEVASASGDSLSIVENVPDWQSAKSSVSILFDANSNLPAEGELPKLDRIAGQALSNINSKIALTGYAGEFDSMDQADLLSQNRVLAVKYYFIGKGVDADRLVVLPQAHIKKDQMQAETYRRVEIRIYTEP